MNLSVSQEAREKNPFTYTTSKVLTEGNQVGKVGTIFACAAQIIAGTTATVPIRFKLQIPMYMFDVFEAFAIYHVHLVNGCSIGFPVLQMLSGE